MNARLIDFRKFRDSDSATEIKSFPRNWKITRETRDSVFLPIFLSNLLRDRALSRR